jgi:hypothetical protein
MEPSSFFQHAPSLLLPSTALIPCHCPALVKNPQLHDYSLMHHILFSLSQSSLHLGTPMHCAASSKFCCLQRPSDTLVFTRLEHALEQNCQLIYAAGVIFGIKGRLLPKPLSFGTLFHAKATQRLCFPTVPLSDPKLQCVTCICLCHRG